MSHPDEIGTCTCRIKGCELISSVRKFKTGRRKGQLYVVCPVHSQSINYGQGFQDDILENTTMHGPKPAAPPEPPVIDAPAPEPLPVAPPVPAPVPAPGPAPGPAPELQKKPLFPLFRR